MKEITKNKNGTYAVHIILKQGVMHYNTDGADSNMELVSIAQTVVTAIKQTKDDAEAMEYVQALRQAGGGNYDYDTLNPIDEIAKEIKKLWVKPYFGAMPYIDAMLSLKTVQDKFHYDTAEDILVRFLCNAMRWRGADARRLKQDIKNHLNMLNNEQA